MTRVQLLGSLDPDTRQWNDGVLTTTAIQVNAEPEGATDGGSFIRMKDDNCVLLNRC